MRDATRCCTTSPQERGNKPNPPSSTILSSNAETVRDVLDALEPGREPAYTTVMTVMSRLADEGVLTRVLVGKTYVYRPACTREEFRARIAGTIVNDLVTDFGDLAIAQFVDAIERADPASLERLRTFLDSREHGDHGA